MYNYMAWDERHGCSLIRRNTSLEFFPEQGNVA